MLTCPNKTDVFNEHNTFARDKGTTDWLCCTCGHIVTGTPDRTTIFVGYDTDANIKRKEIDISGCSDEHCGHCEFLSGYVMLKRYSWCSASGQPQRIDKINQNQAKRLAWCKKNEIGRKNLHTSK